jgi:hypothetical protein
MQWRWQWRRAWILVALAAAPAPGCAVVSSELDTATELYGNAQYEAALRWLDELEADAAGMTRTQQALFYYLRGMTAYRLGQRQDALHFLAIATVAADSPGATLRPERRSILERTLQELIPTTASPHARNAQ